MVTNLRTKYKNLKTEKYNNINVPLTLCKMYRNEDKKILDRNSDDDWQFDQSRNQC